MINAANLGRFEYWSGRSNYIPPKSVQSVLGIAVDQAKGNVSYGNSCGGGTCSNNSCGSGSCNCGGGCSSECNTSCDSD